MFNREDKLENERLKAEIENYQSQLKIKSMEYDKLKDQYVHKNNELIDLVTQVFMSFRKLIEIAERNDYGDPKQKLRQINEYAQEQRNYYAQLTLDTPYIKNRTTTTDQSNK